ncbi:signal peptide peptidase [Prunus dulcis]|uniref:Signal peptide peptidase n=1 Tax=Prunus dulcis TaxID=3755 RepID=A0A4Y1QU55_PRUDU|nr:signal peptide peptidase [Prunus dulcis]
MKNVERVANVALAGLTLAPLVVNVDPNLNVILTACLTVFVGCYRSVKPTPPSETMSNEHAMRFPFVGSAMLLSLFLLFKFLSKDLVNAVLTCYFFVLGIIALRQHCYLLLHVICRRVGIRTLSYGIFHISGLWRLSSQDLRLLLQSLEPFLCMGIEMLSLGSFKTGAILLAGLFVYDIFWVFFTPVMVSVAKSFDAPIKVCTPDPDRSRSFCQYATRPFSMLGLGDIVIPGIFVALALRFDVSRGKQGQYFKSAFLGYTIGLVLTIVVMNWFSGSTVMVSASQLIYYNPPCCSLFTACTVLLEFDESKTVETSEEGSETKSNKKVE